MKTKALVCVALFGVQHFAWAAALDVTAGTLGDWIVKGSPPESSTLEQAFTLPKGSSISHEFSAPDILVRLTTRPNFNADAGDLALLELGPASLSFVREGGEGRLAVLVGEKTFEILPDAIELDAAGQALAPVEVELALHEKAVSVAVAGKVHVFPYEPVATALKITVSSGASQPWTFDRFTIETPDTIDAGSKAGDLAHGSDGADKDKLTTKKTPAGDGAAGGGGQSIGAGSAAAPAKLTQGPGSLEVFTPPSVRSIRDKIATHLNEKAQR